MPNKTIYLQKNPKTFSIFFFIMGLFQSVSTTVRISSGNYGYVEIIFLAFSILIIILAIAMFPKFRFLPHVEVNSDVIKIKPELHNKTSLVQWKLIQKVIFGSYKIGFLLKDGTQETFILPKIPDISVSVKEAIREICSAKEIEIERS